MCSSHSLNGSLPIVQALVYTVGMFVQVAKPIFLRYKSDNIIFSIQSFIVLAWARSKVKV